MVHRAESDMTCHTVGICVIHGYPKVKLHDLRSWVIGPEPDDPGIVFEDGFDEPSLKRSAVILPGKEFDKSIACRVKETEAGRIRTDP
jgi:hypothetical protein